jgi:hypothetical protein
MMTRSCDRLPPPPPPPAHPAPLVLLVITCLRALCVCVPPPPSPPNGKNKTHTQVGTFMSLGSFDALSFAIIDTLRRLLVVSQNG